MKEKITIIYKMLGIVLLVLLIIFLGLNIFGLKLNANFFTYKKAYKDNDCINKLEYLKVEYERIFGENSGGNPIERTKPFCTSRPSLFFQK